MKNLVSVGSFGAKIAIVITATVGGTALVGSSVFASLTATANNATPQSVSSGSLKLTQTSTTSGLTAGFTTPATPLAPGDTINRFVELTNTGSLAGASMTLGLVAGAATALTNDSIRGLQVAVYECVGGAYTSVAGACVGGTDTALVGTSAAPIPASTIVSTAQTITLSAAALASAGTARLKFIISLPASAEVSSNGTLPAPTGGSIQGLTAALTWTFTETQRTGSSTNA